MQELVLAGIGLHRPSLAYARCPTFAAFEGPPLSRPPMSNRHIHA